jgi:hypothetical protein
MSQAPSPFKKVGIKTTVQSDIETLFKDLKKRAPEIRDLFSHQADILREYHGKFSKAADVSLELPTGSGKTLVGLLIAEWRRKTLGQRVLYLCPTKQLANQVYQRSMEYGIETKLFVGSKKDYDKKDLLAYRSSQVIAISTYKGLFNISPGINDPQTIILDDSHGAETYISSMWSLEINKQEHNEFFLKIVELFEKDISPTLVTFLHNEQKTKIPIKTEKVPLGAYYRKLPLFRGLLEDIIPKLEDSELYFSWLAVREGLQACHVYISQDEILIRPYICPTLTHKPFSNAEQRIYMSATLGRGGELERITGVGKIERIPTPKTYLSRSIGRRLFLFPDLSNTADDYSKWISHRLSSVKRTLVLCPNQYEAQKFISIANSCPKKLQIFQAKDIEEDLRVFTASGQSVLVLTNRYDGIDLPHCICQQIILDGLPSKTNLQETFLEERLGLDILLRERIKTRIEQASGRCTRSDTDSAAVIMLGNRLLDFCARSENQKIFHPEIRAEIQFAIEQQNSLDVLDAMVKSFIDKDSDWNEAEQNIASLRDSQEMPDTAVTNVLASVVCEEVNYAYALWAQDFDKAVMHGRQVVDGLSGNAVSSYRALWSFFVAGAAFVQSLADTKFEAVVIDFIDRAKATCKTISWFSQELKFMLPEKINIDEAIDLQAQQIEEILKQLSKLGSAGRKFQAKVDEVEVLLKSKQAKDFDRGLVELGSLLGFTSWKPDGTASPDAIWQLGYKQVFVLEGKSDEAADQGISVQNCRQTSGHLDWAKAEETLTSVKEKYSILVTPKSFIDKDALPFADGVYFFAIADIQKLFSRVKSALIQSREVMTRDTTDEVRERILQKLIENGITSKEIEKLLTTKFLKDLSTSAEKNVSG